MLSRIAIPFLLFIFLLNKSYSQDLHFSDYNHAPSYLSPTQVGNYYGTMRIGVSYRDQSRAFISNPFQTQMLHFDSNVRLGFAKHHWTSFGLAVSNDITGDLGFKKSAALLSLTYHLALDKKYKKVFRIGVQYGMIQSAADATNAIFGDEISSGESIDRSLIDGFSTSYQDINAGISFKNQLSKTSSIEIGISVYHIAQPSFLFEKGNVRNTINKRFNLFGWYRKQVNKKFTVIPTLFLSKMGTAYNYNFQFRTERLLDKAGEKNLQMGLGYRYADAIQILFGFKLSEWNFSMAYDLTISSQASYNNTFGGIEIGVQRFINIYKVPKVPKVILCKEI